ncbi:hypothetical protein ACWZHB_08170 [Nocardia sp. FBN12]|uniref:hypothetical protein n=1 Tax=Nocardia sp. FBN12 TaxID=3419766 RepID=UPI003D06BC18
MLDDHDGVALVDQAVPDARDRLFAPSYRFLAVWLTERAAQEGLPERDLEATTIWLGAIENYWVMTNVYPTARPGH